MNPISALRDYDLQSARILIVDDQEANVSLLERILQEAGYRGVKSVTDARQALPLYSEFKPDLLLLDLLMPYVDGFTVMEQLKPLLPDSSYLPILVLTADISPEAKQRALAMGAQDFLTKPFDPVEVLLRIRNLLETRFLHLALERHSRTLEEKVGQQVTEIARMARLKRYLSPQIADIVLKSDEETLFKGHRREITVVCIGLPGFQGFVDAAEPEEVLTVLKDFHVEMGRLVFLFKGTVERLTGGGLTVFFNDPIPSPDHLEQAVRMALEVRESARDLHQDWLRAGYHLDVAVGLASGYATLGEIGFEGRKEYAAVGNAPNLAAGLCDLAKGGQVLTDQKTASKLAHLVEGDLQGQVHLKELSRPVSVVNLVTLKAASTEKTFAPLSRREQEVAVLVAKGHSNREIAKTLFIGERTVESHVKNILNKLGVHARDEVAAWAIARGLHKVSR